VHAEACRWEHVMSEAVERRLLELLGQPTVSPYGNPIPGLAELGIAPDDRASTGPLVSLDAVATDEPQRLVVRRIGEPLQVDPEVMGALRRAGVRPGEVVKATLSAGGVLVGSGMEYAELALDRAALVFVEARGRASGP
jgi:DtxR family transcriptional regulator, Mn-dependent transcriptional regulator